MLIDEFSRKTYGSILKDEQLNAHCNSLKDVQKILIVHSQIFANSLRASIRKIDAKADITVASWFEMLDEYMEDGDVHLKEEDDLIDLAAGGFDLIIGDEILKKMMPEYKGKFFNIPEFSISGKKRAGI